MFISKSAVPESVEKDKETNPQDYGYVKDAIAQVNTVHCSFSRALRRSSRGVFNSSSKISLILCIANLKDQQRPEQFPVIFLFFQLVFNEIIDYAQWPVSCGAQV
jgi:hypothetical protein